jgi:hypothetical protein
MEVVFTYGHRIFGERVLPILILLVAAYLFVTWKPGTPPGSIARIFPILVDWQFALGLVYFIYRFVVGTAPAYYLSPLFLLHPLLGLAAVVIAHRAVKPQGLFSGWGRWAPVASLALMLVVVLINIYTARNAVASALLGFWL